MTRTSRWQKLIGVLGLGVVLWVGTDLVDIITSGSQPPGGAPDHRPPGSTPRSFVDDGDRTPRGGNGHDPSQFNH